MQAVKAAFRSSQRVEDVVEIGKPREHGHCRHLKRLFLVLAAKSASLQEKTILAYN